MKRHGYLYWLVAIAVGVAIGEFLHPVELVKALFGKGAKS